MQEPFFFLFLTLMYFTLVEFLSDCYIGAGVQIRFFWLLTLYNLINLDFWYYELYMGIQNFHQICGGSKPDQLYFCFILMESLWILMNNIFHFRVAATNIFTRGGVQGDFRYCLLYIENKSYHIDFGLNWLRKHVFCSNLINICIKPKHYKKNWTQVYITKNGNFSGHALSPLVQISH